MTLWIYAQRINEHCSTCSPILRNIGREGRQNKAHFQPIFTCSCRRIDALCSMVVPWAECVITTTVTKEQKRKKTRRKKFRKDCI